MPALTQFVNGLKKRIKKSGEESAKVLKVGVQIPLPQVIRKFRGQHLQGILLKRGIVLLFIMPIILLITYLINCFKYLCAIIIPLSIVDFEAKTYRTIVVFSSFSFFLCGAGNKAIEN